MLYLVNTGVLLRAVDRGSADHAAIMAALRKLLTQQDALSTSVQCIREFWNVSTRPASARGGYGRSIERTLRWIRSFGRILRILPETPATYIRWREVVEESQVIGVQVHDANVAAVADVYGAGVILTLNPADFSRFRSLHAVTPEEVVAAIP